jgi:L-rhamnose mutarotase
MRYCLALDLQNDDAIIAEYEKWHQQVWPEIKTSIVDAGINQMEIYRTGNRLFMIMETLDTFSFERKALQDMNNPKVVEWEKLMWNYQKALPWAKEGEKWVLMKHIFAL